MFWGALLYVPSLVEARVVSKRKRTFFVEAPHLWNSLTKGLARLSLHAFCKKKEPWICHPLVKELFYCLSSVVLVLLFGCLYFVLNLVFLSIFDPLSPFGWDYVLERQNINKINKQQGLKSRCIVQEISIASEFRLVCLGLSFYSMVRKS